MEQDKEEEDDFAHQVGKRPRKEPLFGGALQTIVFPGTRQRDKRSHHRAGNKQPQRCRSDDRKRCRIGDRSQSTLYSTKSYPFNPPKSGKIAVKVINHYGDEVLKVYPLQPG